VLEPAGVGVLSEESGRHWPDRDVTVVLDPLDGSTNASRGIPWFGTSLCAVDPDGPLAALVVNLASGRRATAVRGQGAFVEGRPAVPSAAVELSASIVGLSGMPPGWLGWKQYRALGAAALDPPTGHSTGTSTAPGAPTVPGTTWAVSWCVRKPGPPSPTPRVAISSSSTTMLAAPPWPRPRPPYWRSFARVALRAFMLLPRWMRRLLVRVGKPSYTVGAVGVIVHDGAVLLVRLSYRKDWAMPGGLLNRGETPEAAVVRELWEEVGVAVVAGGQPGVVVDPRHRRVDVVFRCELGPGVDAGDARPRSAEILEVSWFPLDSLPALQQEAARALQLAGHVAEVSQWLRRTRSAAPWGRKGGEAW
jgi:ADP-ribose pyrophosphatase YjhB (NUDIX family)